SEQAQQGQPGCWLLAVRASAAKALLLLAVLRRCAAEPAWLLAVLRSCRCHNGWANLSPLAAVEAVAGWLAGIQAAHCSPTAGWSLSRMTLCSGWLLQVCVASWWLAAQVQDASGRVVQGLAWLVGMVGMELAVCCQGF
ncbi:hypothetical protein V8C86DRAFT_2710060, partial [Haematococcus lacustris]